MTDAQLDDLWKKHLAGEPLGSDTTTCEADGVKEIEKGNRRWQRDDQQRRWHEVPSIRDSGIKTGDTKR